MQLPLGQPGQPWSPPPAAQLLSGRRSAVPAGNEFRAGWNGTTGPTRAVRPRALGLQVVGRLVDNPVGRAAAGLGRRTRRRRAPAGSTLWPTQPPRRRSAPALALRRVPGRTPGRVSPAARSTAPRARAPRGCALDPDDARRGRGLRPFGPAGDGGGDVWVRPAAARPAAVAAAVPATPAASTPTSQ